MMRLLLTVAYFLILLPVALVERLAGRDRLGAKPADSHWHRRSRPEPWRHSLRHPF